MTDFENWGTGEGEFNSEEKQGQLGKEAARSIFSVTRDWRGIHEAGNEFIKSSEIWIGDVATWESHPPGDARQYRPIWNLIKQ